MADLTPETLAAACRCPLANVRTHWPTVLQALRDIGIDSLDVQIGAAATIAVETAWTFQPINERGGPDYFTKHYEGRTDLGNCRPGDGALFHGRGFVQITGRVNYRAMSHIAGCDLEAHPEQALFPVPAAKILASYFATRRVAEACMAHDWHHVRTRVNGGLNGWPDFIGCVERLGGVV